MNRATTTGNVVEHLDGSSGFDELAVEEPLEIRLGHGPVHDRQTLSLAITMRTPGDDEALATGFLLTEGLITTARQIGSIGPCGETTEGQSLRVELAADVVIEPDRLARHFYISSSCGVCGKSALQALHAAGGRSLLSVPFTIASPVLQNLPARLASEQRHFQTTGGLHAAALFDSGGKLLHTCEDVGRHNAVDKLAGTAARNGSLPLNHCGLLLSGRASFELIQKAVMMGTPLVAAIGAPSSLAVASAEHFGITLVGFLRPDRGNVYSHSQRVIRS